MRKYLTGFCAAAILVVSMAQATVSPGVNLNRASGTLAVTNGGTGLVTYAIGDIPYASAATTLASLAAVSTGQVLVSGGAATAPAYSANPIVNSVASSAYRVTAGSGTGITVNDAGTLRRQVYKVSIAFGAFTCNATTCDITLATLPAKSKVVGVTADLTTPFVCAQTCTTATLSFTVGSTAGGTQYLLSADADAAAAQFGLTAGTTGAQLVANIVQGGDVPSWASTTAIVLRFTSAVGNVATAGVTNLNAGAITIYITAEILG